MSNTTSTKKEFNLERIKFAMTVLNNQQALLWIKSRELEEKDPKLSNYLWEMSLQIEHALLEINEEVLGRKSWFESEDTSRA